MNFRSHSLECKNLCNFQLDQASLGLRREFLTKGFDEKLVKAYYDYMVDIAVLFGAERERATKELKDSLEFEMKLANVSLIDFSFLICEIIRVVLF